MVDRLILIDGIKWHDAYGGNTRNIRVQYLEAICPKHNLRMSATGTSIIRSTTLHCFEGNGHDIKLARYYPTQKGYVVDKIDAQAFSQMPILNLDDEAIPVAKEDLKGTDYWVRARVTESKSGTRLIVWAGSKKAKNKAQLFIEPELKRMSFDQNDDHPLEVFAKVEATFNRGIKSKLEKT